ncbi:hypothetical protein jhhlp_000081 [Lomentospora prolificans]|uniref:SH3 domain-containing protein n=1 Tax=Lomentospora prolificans TaxID=41688 RepID=A0A2N3NLJ3_9PEZI|nr:hypothetical protein jhhlp_000081 [Lomentospora prolificans]
MPKPKIIRADTIDLQDHTRPSAQDHSKSNLRSTPSLSIGPHQAETLREVAHETADENLRSPRLAWDKPTELQSDDEDVDIDIDIDDTEIKPRANGQSNSEDDSSRRDNKMHQQDALAVAQNGGVQDDSDMEMDGDDYDDDMTGGISSSPSIEDGPRRVDSLPGTHRRVASPSPNPSRIAPPEIFPVSSKISFLTSDSSERSDSFETSIEMMGGDLLVEALRQNENVSSHHHLLPRQTADDPSDDEMSARLIPGTRQFYDNYSISSTNSLDNANYPPFHSESLISEMEEELSRWPLNTAHELDFHAKRKEYERGEHIGGPDDLGDGNELDGLAIPCIMDEPEDGDGSDDSFPDNVDPKYIASGWAVECLQDPEDIDFEYVYALHTFVATVDGQANATKGDTMVLLDDSNSYWWLVRIVKDSSIGYLPAEHIETPTERLARLNKHRNIDLSATMLGDQAAEKSKPTFKTAIRRRKKTVTFAAPTYVDYEDYDYSSDDEDQEEIFAQQQAAAKQAREQAAAAAAAAESQQIDIESESEIEDETARVEPLKPRVVKEAKMTDSAKNSTDDSHLKRASEDMFDGKADNISRSRNGTVRNTDSFFKDDTVETKKITLTPNLLRDDNTPRDSTDSKEVRPRPSLDKVLDKDKDDKKKKDKDKKDKDKKPSVIRNFFSRKDKKKGSGDDYDDEPKKSMDGSEPRDSKDHEEVEAETSAATPQRHPSKLQKQMPRTEPSPTRKGPTAGKPADIGAYISETRNDVSNVPPATMRIVDSETQETREVSSQPTREELTRGNGPSAGLSDAQNKSTPAQETLRAPLSQSNERSTESPVQPSSPTSANRPPPLMVDTSSQEDHSASSSPELLDVDADDSGRRGQDSVTATSTTSTSTWNDSKLRAFFDAGSDIKDMLVVVYDKTDVAPAGPDHPIVGSLFREQNAKLAEITTQLDNMLGDWLARKQRLRGTI